MPTMPTMPVIPKTLFRDAVHDVINQANKAKTTSVQIILKAFKSGELSKRRRSTYTYDCVDNKQLSVEEIALEDSFAHCLAFAAFWDSLEIGRDEKVMDEKLFSKFLLTEEQSKSMGVGLKWNEGFESGIGFNEFSLIISKLSAETIVTDNNGEVDRLSSDFEKTV